jgi:cobalt-precorrin 5A hydrolase
MQEEDRLTDFGRPEMAALPARLHVLGMGCERGAPLSDLRMLAEKAMLDAGVGPSEIACLASIDMKREEPAMLALAAYLDIPVRFFDAATLEKETPRLKNPSELVYSRVGCHGVAEAACLAAAGPKASLIVPKLKSSFSTAAIAKMD